MKTARTNESATSQKTPQKRIRGDASKRLRRSCIKVVRNHSEAIAKALLDFTLEGDTGCAKLLVSLIQVAAAPANAPKARKPMPPPPPPARPDPPKPRRSIAAQLASEPEWTGPVDGEGSAIKEWAKILGVDEP